MNRTILAKTVLLVTSKMAPSAKTLTNVIMQLMTVERTPLVIILMGLLNATVNQEGSIFIDRISD